MTRGSRSAPPPPEFLVDRSLGRLAFPSTLAAQGVIVRTLWDVWGKDAEDKLADDEWVKRAASEGWFALTADKKVRKDYPGLLQQHPIGVFQLAGQITAAEQAKRFLNRRAVIERHCRNTAVPFIAAVGVQAVDIFWTP